MARFIDNNLLYVKTLPEAIDKILNEDFAFIGESNFENSLSPEQLCQIQQVGKEPLMTLFHAIGMRKGRICSEINVGFLKCKSLLILIFNHFDDKDYKHRAELNKALLKMYVDGTMSILEKRWMRNKYVQCQVSIGSKTQKRLHEAPKHKKRPLFKSFKLFSDEKNENFHKSFTHTCSTPLFQLYIKLLSD